MWVSLGVGWISPGLGTSRASPDTPVAVAISFMGFPFKSLQASCPCAPQGCAKLGPLKQAAGMRVLPPQA